MYEILYAGHRLLTTDAVAEALLQYAGELASRGMVDTITVPIVEAGLATTCRLILGHGTSLGIVFQSNREALLPGADEAFIELGARLSSLRVS
ncbi:hypothetical protein ACIQLJ_15015 [Microbacterium sp. NPDC091313]